MGHVTIIPVCKTTRETIETYLKQYNQNATADVYIQENVAETVLMFLSMREYKELESGWPITREIDAFDFLAMVGYEAQSLASKIDWR
jgi:hypothetical protein